MHIFTGLFVNCLVFSIRTFTLICLDVFDAFILCNRKRYLYLPPPNKFARYGKKILDPPPKYFTVGKLFKNLQMMSVNNVSELS